MEREKSALRSNKTEKSETKTNSKPLGKSEVSEKIINFKINIIPKSMKIVDDYVSVNDVVPESFGFTSEDDIAAIKTDDRLLLQVERRRDSCFEEWSRFIFIFQNNFQNNEL